MTEETVQKKALEGLENGYLDEINTLKQKLALKDSMIESLIEANQTLLRSYDNVQKYILKEDPLKELTIRE